MSAESHAAGLLKAGLQLGWLWLSLSLPLQACTLCGVPPETLSELVSKADHAVIARRTGTKPPSVEHPSGQLVLAVTQVLTSSPERSPETALRPGSEVLLPLFGEGSTSDLFFLTGAVVEGERSITWGYFQDMTPAAVTYLTGIPPKTETLSARLTYFLNALEHPDVIASNDAWGELAGSPFEKLVGVRSNLPVEKLRHWLRDSATLETRLGLYGLLLGIGGDPQDFALLEQVATSPLEQYNIGRPANLGGFLILGRERAHASVHHQIILNPEATFDQRFAALEVFRFLWIYQPDAVPAEKLKASMHCLLQDPEFAALVVVDLARWQDWSIIDEVVRLFEHPDFSDDATRRPILRFLQAAAKHQPAEPATGQPADSELPDHVLAARAHLEQLCQKYPEFFRTAGRFQPD